MDWKPLLSSLPHCGLTNISWHIYHITGESFSCSTFLGQLKEPYTQLANMKAYSDQPQIKSANFNQLQMWRFTRVKNLPLIMVCSLWWIVWIIFRPSVPIQSFQSIWRRVRANYCQCSRNHQLGIWNIIAACVLSGVQWSK